MRTLIILIVALLLCSPTIFFGQGKPNFVGEWYLSVAQGKSPVRSEGFSRGQSDFTRTKRYNLRANINQLNSLMNTKPELVDLVVPYGDRTYVLNLAKTEVVSEHFEVTTNRGNGNYRKQGVQYRGIVDGNPAHIASLNITPTDKSAYFSTHEGNFVITKDGVDFIVYNVETMDVPGIIYCETPTTSVPITVDPNLISGIGCKTVNVYFECDYAFYQNKGSNIATLTDYVIGFFNQVATLYANEDIAIRISSMFAWTSTDPYASYTTPSAILEPFRTTRGTNYNGNIAHFLTTRSNIIGGIAYVDALCNKTYAFGVSKVSSTYLSFPTYSWTVNVVAHELGHTIASPHTHSCTWTGGALDNCGTPEGSCATGPAPSNGGTIMSYCHMTGAGINFNNGFGTQPGNLLRSRVQNASCITAGTLANPPVSLATNAITATSATLSWAATPSTNVYTVRYKLAAASTWTTATTTSTSFNLTGLSASTNYLWSVKTDCSEYAPNISFATTSGGSSLCNAPINLTTSNITQTGATLNWAAVVGATGYTVQYKTAAASTWITVNASVATTSISGLTAATNYVWQVKASCSTGYSAQASFTTSPTSGCSAPTNLASSGISQTGVTLSWGAVSGASGYTLQYRRSTVSTWTTVSTTSTSRALTGLIAGTAYVWQVKASCSAYSSQAGFTTSSSSGSGCGVPAGLATSNITANSSTLSWAAVPNATSYTVRYKLVGASGWTFISNVTGTSYRLSNLSTKRNYTWALTAKCSNGSTSSVSASSNFTTL